ncbi:hypothetical protein SLEP1_g41105 [Rubroshorea leprosula]|uniref:Ribosomal protein L32 n=1 Tax=Rubroshorea leprosula TaxID=152421 RepID=A0AAV5L5I4_9ROSI|nr:hypothetical protein SLEP1_g41105 [Rubroshorea leprosula]
MECRKPALKAPAGSTGKNLKTVAWRARRRRKAGSNFIAGYEGAFNAQRSSHLKIINVFKVGVAKPAQSFATSSREK